MNDVSTYLSYNLLPINNKKETKYTYLLIEDNNKTFSQLPISWLEWTGE